MEFWGSFLAAGGGAAAISFALFHFLGRSLLEEWFERKKEDYRQQNARELEYTRVRLDSVLRAVVAVREREYAILPEAWARLAETLDAVSLQTALFLDDSFFLDPEGRLRDGWENELDELVTAPPFTRAERAAIASAEDPLEAYARAHRAMGTRRALAAHGVLRRYLLAESIFLPDALKDRFAELADGLYELILDTDVNGTDPERNDRYRVLRTEAFDFSRELYARLTRHGTWLGDPVDEEAPAPARDL